MFLRQIELLGFKSFAGRTQIDLAEGITVLIGPNGCGKSNVVDAVKWVLGEQSTKSMRTDRMESVIFNGSETAPALGVAEVALHIQNEQELLGLDFSEIVIKRRLFREGESEYFINGAPVRLKDLREVFLDTGIGRSAYSIMEQGQIDQILSSRPEERRHVFEEAAGVSKFRTRAAETERKLSKTEQNVVQIRNILQEVERRYQLLEKQVLKTRQYRAYEEEAFQLDLALKQGKLAKLKEREACFQGDLEKRQNHHDSLKKEIESTRENLQEEVSQMTQLATRLSEGQKELYGTDLQGRNHEEQAHLLERQEEEGRAQLALLSDQGRAARERIERLEKEIAEKQSHQKHLLAQRKDLQIDLANCQEILNEVGHRLEKNHQNARTLEEQNRRREEEQAKLSLQLRHLTEEIARALEEGLSKGNFASYKENLSLAEEIYQGLKVRLRGRLKLCEDVLLGECSQQEHTSFIEGLSQVLEETLKKISELQKLSLSREGHHLSFLEEMLTPEGVIEKKRQIDRKISLLLEQTKTDQNRIRALRSENEDLAKRRQEHQGVLEELRVGDTRVEGSIASLKETLRLSLRTLEEKKQLLRELEMRHKEFQRRGEKLKRHLRKLSEDKENLALQRSKIEGSLKKISTQIADYKKEQQKKMATLASLERQQGDLSETLQEAQIRHARLQAEAEALCQQFFERTGRELTSFPSSKKTEPLPKLRDLLRECKTALGALGQVNLMAEEEFTEVKERYEFLSRQYTDLETARKDLQQVTSEITREMGERFTETFKELQGKFHQVFRRLFGGGRGELRLQNPQDVLNSGIDIYAQPPGKKLEGISLLSGGERSLTGVSLLLAVYLIKPSPFCVLDEIDAALDDNNVQRFVELLQEFSDRTQFIVITHNRRTIAGANNLIGVTMEDRGVSKMVSVKLSRQKGER